MDNTRSITPLCQAEMQQRSITKPCPSLSSTQQLSPIPFRSGSGLGGGTGATACDRPGGPGTGQGRESWRAGAVKGNRDRERGRKRERETKRETRTWCQPIHQASWGGERWGWEGGARLPRLVADATARGRRN